MKNYVGLAPCGNMKSDVPREAIALYTGAYVQAVFRWCLRNFGLKWKILSAEHGVVDPYEPLSPYDLMIESKEAPRWRLDVEKKLRELYDRDQMFLDFSSGRYCLIGENYLSVWVNLTKYNKNFGTVRRIAFLERNRFLNEEFLDLIIKGIDE